MIKSDLHVHTTYSDGKNTPEEVIEAAIAKGMTTISISDHSYTPFDESYCIRKDRQEAYFDELSALQAKYKGRIDVKIGLELDRYAPLPERPFEYTIGSVHYVKRGEAYLPVDESKDSLLASVKTRFGGDVLAFCEAYYEAVEELADLPVTVVGHFDLVTKFNENGDLFDENAPRYVKAWQKAADKLLKKKIPFEINTGAVARGYRTTPYPSRAIRDYLKARGARFLLASDSHEKNTLLYAFDKWETLL